ncbi:MAG: GerMN domain-containing protein [Desulfobacterales bacterium]|nr:GerMN domain-containing protein [Desulfobacterales bacterium]
MTIRRNSLIAILAVCIAATGLFAYFYHAFWSPDEKSRSEAGPHRFLLKSGRARVHLYFSDTDHRFLTTEDRSLAQPYSAVERARSIVYALIDGPNGPLTPTIPAETRLLAIYVTQDGIACVDFNRAISEKHPGGSLSELLSIFSIVNTLALNIPEIKAVKILIEGDEAETLAGHIDIRSPFRPNMLMIK